MAYYQVSAAKAPLTMPGSGDTGIAYGDGDTITGGSHDTIYLAGDNETFLSGSGYNAGGDQVAAYGDGDTIKISAGNVTTYGQGETVNAFAYRIGDHLGPLGTVHVVAAGNSSAFVTGDGSVMSFQNGSGFSVYLGGTATHSDVNLGQGGGVAVGGEDGEGYAPNGTAPQGVYWQGANTLVAGLKASTLYGSNHGSNNLVASGNGGDGLVGGANSTNVMDGRNSTGNDFMEGHQGAYAAERGYLSSPAPSPSNVMFAGSGNDTLVAGSGYNEIHAGSGADLIAVFNNAANQVAGGNNIMLDSFKPGVDHIDLIGYGGATADLLAGAQHANGGTQMQLADGAHLNVAGVNLTANDIFRQ